MTRILFVCAGNKCRSPAAAAIFSKLAKDAGRSLEFRVDSAGTYAKGAGQPADARMVLAGAKRGYDIKTLARRISNKDVYLHDLIVTMDAANLAYVQAMIPKASLFRTARVQPVAADDVPDPYYGDRKAFDTTLDRLEIACSDLLKGL